MELRTKEQQISEIEILNVKGEIDTFQLKMFLNVWDISFHGSGQKTQLILNDGNHMTYDHMCTMSLCHL